MTNEKLQSIIRDMPDRIRVSDDIEWFTRPLKRMTWCKMDTTRIFDKVPDGVSDCGRLLTKYDNAWDKNNGITPSVNDYKHLFDVCNTIPVQGDNGILLSKDNSYIYFAEGDYWTSSCEENDVGEPQPQCLCIENGKFCFSKKYTAHKKLYIMAIVCTKK